MTTNGRQTDGPTGRRTDGPADPPLDIPRQPPVLLEPALFITGRPIGWSVGRTVG